MLENITAAIKQLFKAAENNKDNHNIDNAVGEVTIVGVEYQIQVSLISDKKMWIKDNEIRYSEVVKIH